MRIILARSLAAQGKPGEAEAEFKRAASASINYEAMFEFASFYLMQDEYAKALAPAEKALAFQERYPWCRPKDKGEIYRVLSRIHAGLGDETKSREFTAKA